MNATPKTHWHGNNSGWRTLFCSGRSVMYALTTQTPDEVTCGSCRRKLVRMAKAA